LRNGDFEVGDRIIVSYEGLRLQRTDTLLVQTGRTVRLGEPMGDLNLTGVLWFEVADSITNRFAKYYKSAVVHVAPLLRVSISGAVRSPGYHYARSDMRLNDVLMRIGGTEPSTDLDDVVIKRGDQVVWPKESVRSALRDGLTLEALNFEPGDEIVVGERQTRPWTTTALQFGLPVLSAVLLQLLFRR
jgi:protein involved in polysaccharide export with SLBB domain